MKSDSNLFWVALQSNLLADTSYVEDDFKEELTKMKAELTKEGWVFPQLEANMRNQANISNINVEWSGGSYPMQSSIKKLQSATNIVGEIPTLIKVEDEHQDGWNKKKDAILEHCLKEMDEKDNKNLVVLFDDDWFEDVDSDLKTLVKKKTVVEYPSKQNKQKGEQNIKDFIEKDNHILVTRNRYFNGCEASKVLFLTWNSAGVRNSLMRSVKNLTCVDIDPGGLTTINGMKEDKRFQ